MAGAPTAITVIGPTASGKTRRAVSIAENFNGEIISADSRQVYRGMTIGTGKDLCEYRNIPYHLIDIRNAGDKYNLFDFLQDFNLAYDNIRAKGKRPVICGGSGMYVENAINGIRLPDVPENKELRASLSDKSLDELTEILSRYKTLHNTTDVDTAKRAIRAIEIQDYYLKNPHLSALTDSKQAQHIDTLIVGIDIPRDDRRRLISKRLRDRIDEGMISEVQRLIEYGIDPADLIYYGLEYKYVTLYVIGDITYDQMIHDLEIAIHQFAKRQMTWFRGMEKRGSKIHWLRYDISESEFLTQIRNLIH